MCYIKINLEIYNMNCSELIRFRIQWRAVVDAIMSLGFLKRQESFGHLSEDQIPEKACDGGCDKTRTENVQ
jgi:hypothetical protein